MGTAAFLYLFLFLVVEGCPSMESIKPCVCDRPGGESAYITCAGLDNDQDLLRIAGAIQGKSYIYSFTLEKSILNFIPSDVFKGNRFVELEIKGSSLMALTDTDIAFQGMEDYLETLLITECTLMSEWDWTIFRNLKKLMRLEVIGSDLDSLEDIESIEITSLTDISFERNRISFVHPEAFKSFKDLRILSLNDNEIQEVARSMLPDPALELIQLDLSNNQIELLPTNMFTNMPNLNLLGISNNKILVLNEQTFAPIWESLEHFGAMGNELRCDCRLSWILEKKSPADVRATCAQPNDLKGKNIVHLTSKDLWCYKK